MPGLPESLTRFLAVGAATTVVYFGLLGLAIEVLQVDYRVGVTVAYALAVAFHFWANRHFTFRAGGGRLPSQTLRYAVLVMVNYLVTLAVIYISVDIGRASPYLGAALSIIVSVGVSYVASRFWVFDTRFRTHDQ